VSDAGLFYLPSTKKYDLMVELHAPVVDVIQTNLERAGICSHYLASFEPSYTAQESPLTRHNRIMCQ